MKLEPTNEGKKEYGKKRSEMTFQVVSTLSVAWQKELLRKAKIEYTSKNGILYVMPRDSEGALGLVRRQKGPSTIQIVIDDVEEIYDDIVKGTPTGTSGYIYLPKKWINRKVKVLILER